MRDSERQEYIMGLIDGLLGTGMFGTSYYEVAWLQDCLSERPMHLNQVEAVISAYVRSNPSEWHLPMSLLGYKALEGACR
jgi:hypothetical protein